MNDEQFLRELLDSQEIDIEIEDKFRFIWTEINNRIKSKLDEKYYMYYGGSYRKNTMIRGSYDLDIVIILRPDSEFFTEDLYFLIGDILEDNQWGKIYQNRVSWRIFVENLFHIDIVPAKYSGKIKHECFLFNSEIEKTLKTNIDIHEKIVKESQRQDIIRLLKLWKYRRNIFAKTFILEQIAIIACQKLNPHNLHDQLNACLEYIADNIMSLELSDPANEKNIITDTLTDKKRAYLRDEAIDALNQNSLGDVFTTKYQ